MQKSISINVPGGHISGNVVTAVDYAVEMFITIPYDKFACIDLVMVCPSYRRKGMGSLLVRLFMTQAKSASAKAVFAELVQFNGALTAEDRQTFFEKQGFRFSPVNKEDHDIPPLLMIAEI
jgi:GNAT superfamily N-acetyltransferase